LEQKPAHQAKIFSLLLKLHFQRHSRNNNTVIIARVNTVLLRKTKRHPLGLYFSNEKQTVAAAIAWPVTPRWWNVPTESQLSPVSLVITDSAAQMVEPQMCNNSIKLTSLCFHKVRYTQRHPLEFHILLLFTLHPFQRIILCGQGYNHCLCLLGNHTVFPR